MRSVVFTGACLVAICCEATGDETVWVRHTVDASSRGADGVRPADVNGDGRPDLVVGWEQGGLIRLYLHPGPAKVTQPWPAVTVGKVQSPEDAVFVDVNGDGAVDVVSSCEGRQKTMFVHWAPLDRRDILRDDAWQTEVLPPTENAALWMFALPLEVDGKNGIDLITGAKGSGTGVHWLRSPANPRNTHEWEQLPICPASWIMSLVAEDIDGDGNQDIVFSDRKGGRRGVYWAEQVDRSLRERNSARGASSPQTQWKIHPIGGQGQEVMFLDVADLDRDGLRDVVVAVRGGDLLWLRRTASNSPQWETHTIPLPAGTGTGKSVRVADIDRDGRNDLVFSCENARQKHGAMWLSAVGSGPLTKATWQPHPISGTAEGVKFDLLQLIDLDADGDLDVLTCEESDNLGVIWYENRVKKRSAEPSP